jgi:hypothetical protein
VPERLCGNAEPEAPIELVPFHAGETLNWRLA